jgi:hypothetical protein
VLAAMSPANRAGAVTEEDFRAALESLERAGVSPPPERVQELVAASAALLGQLVASRRHALAIDFLRRLLALAPGDADLRRRLALAYGGHGESILQLADRLRVRPPPTLIDEMQSQFQQATDVSPALADLWWDLAVLSARFRGDLAAARSHLARARSLGYAHPLLGDFPDLEALRFHALAARCFVESDDLRTGGHHVDRARSVQRRFLARGTPELLESFLDEQSLLDSQEVEVRLAERSAEAPVRALLAAESAKGRLLAWLRRLPLGP